jgi:hypothetical protein
MRAIILALIISLAACNYAIILGASTKLVLDPNVPKSLKNPSPFSVSGACTV